jgi:hypothetical protein
MNPDVRYWLAFAHLVAAVIVFAQAADALSV